MATGFPSFQTVGSGFAWSSTARLTCQYLATTPVAQKPADLYWINTVNTGSGRTEVHVLDAGSGYTTYKLHAATALALGNTDQWSFALGDANGDGKTDVYAISRYGNGTPNVEVHILDGSTNYSTFLGHYSTGLGAVQGGLAFTFDIGDYNNDGKPDLYVFQKAGGASGHTEVHIFNGADGFSTRLLDAVMPMAPTGSDDAWEFHVAANAGNNGKPDIVAIAKQNGASTEVHVVSGSSGYTAYSLETATALGLTGTDSKWVFGVKDYDNDGKIDLFGLNKVGTNGAEVHVLKGSAFQEYLVHAATPIGALGTDTSQTLLINH
ncbi:FG-GAP repeat domain-containing protein [Xanthomonas sp. NCPPB 2632]|uniref:FG-GAP repeat domain-containing protein n=1 Tax=Xanthomonas sp. NCPPB 2632 TaxID=3240912 RepID=UPI0035174D06